MLALKALSAQQQKDLAVSSAAWAESSKQAKILRQRLTTSTGLLEDTRRLRDEELKQYLASSSALSARLTALQEKSAAAERQAQELETQLQQSIGSLEKSKDLQGQVISALRSERWLWAGGGVLAGIAGSIAITVAIQLRG
jgi:hypothetical protein